LKQEKKKMTNLLMLCLLFGSPTLSAETLSIKQSDIKYIYDGDTFFIHCQQGFRCKNNKLGVRIMGFDSPEIKGQCQSEKILAREAKQFVVTKIRAAQSIELVINPKKRYGYWKRLLAWVKLDGHDLAEMVIAANLGRVYHGGKRKGWCSKGGARNAKQ
jgi:endonuclease YncB( thermonuclease family)